jgi:hypothetical protein
VRVSACFVKNGFSVASVMVVTAFSQVRGSHLQVTKWRAMTRGSVPYLRSMP